MLNPANVPKELHELIFLANRFGIADDLDREKLLKTLERQQLLHIKKSVLALDDELDIWLAGSESKNTEFSDEYIAFSALRMLADSI